MRLARIASSDGVAFAAIDGDVEGGDPGSPRARAREIAEHPFGTPEFTGRSWPLDDVRLLAPILASKVICIGKNYAAHAAEMGAPAPTDPVIFIKPNTSIIGPLAPIKLPRSSDQVDYEGELAVVIGQPCRDVAASRASSVILGYTVANDVTARDQQKHDGQWTRAKGYDSFCPLGPWIETEFDPTSARIYTELDGRIVQDSTTSKMLHSVGDIVEWISSVMTLLPGDVILTGTPEGVGPVRAGQQVAVTVEGIGTLTNPAEDR